MSPLPLRTGRLRALITVTIALLAAAPLAAQEKPSIIVDDYGPWKRITDVALAPDGSWMAYVQDRLEGEDSLYVNRSNSPTRSSSSFSSGSIDRDIASPNSSMVA
jgi:hypothetical protein